MNTSKIINIKPLKRRAEKLPSDVARLILAEPDMVPYNEFVVKSSVWYRILTMEDD